MLLNGQIWIALRFPHLAMEAVVTSTATPQACAIQHQQRIYMANGEALQQGVRLQMSTTQASQLVPNLHCIVRDQNRELHAFNELINALYAITPHIQPVHLAQQGYGEYSLALEVSRCISLFGDWGNLLDNIHRVLVNTHYRYTLAAAHSEQAAWLLSWCTQHDPLRADFDVLQSQLKTLPIQYLMHFPKLIAPLDSMGFATLGDLWRQIYCQRDQQGCYSTIQKRFGKAFSQYLQHLFQQLNPVKPNYQPPEYFREHIEFEYPVSNIEWLLPACETLLQQLSTFLRVRQQHTQQVVWHLQDIDKNQYQLAVRSHNATDQYSLLLELSAIHFSQQPLPFAVDILELACNQTLTLSAPGADLFSGSRHSKDTAELDKIGSKITARLGSQGLYQLSSLDEHLPEQSQKKVPCLTTVIPGAETGTALRATWLFDRPIVVQNRNQRLFWHGYLKLIQGPERITGQWWTWPEERDYFLAIRDDFTRCWLYYERLRKVWYVQGVFS